MYSTNYHRPSSVEEAASLFAKGKEAKYLAGGHTLLPVMKQRLASPSDVIDLAKIPALIGIDVSGDTVTVKAATTYYDIASNAQVQKALTVFDEASRLLQAGETARREKEKLAQAGGPSKSF